MTFFMPSVYTRRSPRWRSDRFADAHCVDGDYDSTSAEMAALRARERTFKGKAPPSAQSQSNRASEYDQLAALAPAVNVSSNVLFELAFTP
jgi:hypothetical protein